MLSRKAFKSLLGRTRLHERAAPLLILGNIRHRTAITEFYLIVPAPIRYVGPGLHDQARALLPRLVCCRQNLRLAFSCSSHWLFTSISSFTPIPSWLNLKLWPASFHTVTRIVHNSTTELVP